MRKITFGVIVGNRGFFPDALAKAGRKNILDVLKKNGFNSVALSMQQTSYIGIDVGSASKKMYSFEKSSINTQKGERFVKKSLRSYSKMWTSVIDEKDWIASMSGWSFEYGFASVWKDNIQSDYYGVAECRHSANTMPMFPIGPCCHNSDCLLDHDAWYCSPEWQNMDWLRAKFCSSETFCIKIPSNQSKGFSKMSRSMRECYSFPGSKGQLKLPSEEYASFDRGCRKTDNSTIQVQVRESQEIRARNKLPYDRNLLLSTRRNFSEAA